eukprot:CAMPEP_0171250920 /NCGR_PEP_ID=MMETSP0790-20130122/50362_1 /TAXON_ID=2925 /ORGANISM="Alexandrium catenella, Strain OF101" /LENGTH=253 /DNA_ID=CAMNT_0011718581 /DNA_START=63 /DNA_END=824 /DNA_ORIENTATION=-
MAHDIHSGPTPSCSPLAVGSVVSLYSNSAGQWIPAEVVAVHHGGITASYWVDDAQYQKRIRLESSNLRILELETKPRELPASHVEDDRGSCGSATPTRSAWWYWKCSRTWVPYSAEHVSRIEAARDAGNDRVCLMADSELVFHDLGRSRLPDTEEFLEVCRMQIFDGMSPERTLRCVSFAHLARSKSRSSSCSHLSDEELETRRLDRGVQMMSMKDTAEEELSDGAPRGGWFFRMEEEPEEVHIASIEKAACI